MKGVKWMMAIVSFREMTDSVKMSIPTQYKKLINEFIGTMRDEWTPVSNGVRHEFNFDGTKDEYEAFKKWVSIGLNKYVEKMSNEIYEFDWEDVSDDEDGGDNKYQFVVKITHEYTEPETVWPNHNVKWSY